MTPAIEAAKRAKISFQVHQYPHEAHAKSYGEEAAEKLQLPGEQVFKTLVAELDGRELVVAVVPVIAQLNLKALAAALGAKKAVMAKPAQVERSSGYVLGGVSPLAQKKSLRTVIDDSASTFASVFVSAGRRGLEIELAPGDLVSLTQAIVVPIAMAV